MENLQGLTTFRESYSRALEHGPLVPYRGIEEVHGVAVEEEQRDDDGGGDDGAPEDVLGSRSLKLKTF